MPHIPFLLPCYRPWWIWLRSKWFWIYLNWLHSYLQMISILILTYIYKESLTEFMSTSRQPNLLQNPITFLKIRLNAKFARTHWAVRNDATYKFTQKQFLGLILRWNIILFLWWVFMPCSIVVWIGMFPDTFHLSELSHAENSTSRATQTFKSGRCISWRGDMESFRWEISIAI